MTADSKIRRCLAGVCLLLALVMLVLGLTVLDKRLKSYPFLAYWSVCICLTALAAIGALVDLMLLRRQLQREQRRLIEQTLRGAKHDQNGKEND
jgi:hypothetical protein